MDSLEKFFGEERLVFFFFAFACFAIGTVVGIFFVRNGIIPM